MPRNATTPSRTSLVAVLATCLVLSVVALTTSGPASAAPTKGGNARHAQAKAALDAVVQAFGTERSARSAPRTTPLPRRDVTLLLRDLRNGLPSLTGADRARAQRYLARPTDSGGDSVCAGCPLVTLDGTVATRPTQHFLIHYQTNPPLFGPSQVATTQQVDETASVLETVYSKETGALGYRIPLSDASEPSFGSSSNPDNKIDVFLADVGRSPLGLYGYVDADTRSSTAAPYMVLDNDFSPDQFGADAGNSLRVTAAHEFFHAVQYAYDADDDRWFLEGTATWMEDIVYPTINDYLQYLPSSQVAKPLQSADYTGGLSVYGSITFWKYLSERFRDNDIIRQIWTTAAVSNGNRDGIYAVGEVLARRGYSFAPEFARYGVWNTRPPGTYSDRGLWPAPGLWASGTLTRRGRDTGVLSVGIDHLANAPLVLRAGSGLPTRSRLRVVVDGPNTSHGTRATVQIRFRSGKVTTYAVPLTSTGYGSKLYRFNPRYVKSAIVILTNGSAGYNAQLFRVRARLVY